MGREFCEKKNAGSGSNKEILCTAALPLYVVVVGVGNQFTALFREPKFRVIKCNHLKQLALSLLISIILLRGFEEEAELPDDKRGFFDSQK